MKPVYIEVTGNPIAKKRHRDGKNGRKYNPSKEDELSFFDRVYIQIGEFNPIKGPIRLDLTFVLKRPKGHYGTGRNSGRLKKSAPRYHIVKPDRDNLDKLVMDALNGYLWRDDCQVVQGSIMKQYHNPDDVFGPRTLIKVFAIEGE